MAAFGASVKSIIKTGDGTYDVEVECRSPAGPFALKIYSEKDDPKDAVERARELLYEMGVEMAKAFDTPGALK